MFTLRVNGATKGTCTIPTGGTSAVTSTVSLTVNAGDVIDVQVANGNLAGSVTWGLAP